MRLKESSPIFLLPTCEVLMSAMCPLRSTLLDMFDSCNKELAAAQACPPGMEVTRERFMERTERATQNAMKANAALREHMAGCRKCVPLLR
jgi:hypothetical protein